MSESQKIKSAIEALLFVSGEPLSLGTLSKILEVPVREVEEALDVFSKECVSLDRGIRVIVKDGEAQMATNAQLAPQLDRLMKREFQEALSRASLEVLSVVAYRGPISRVDIEAIRGVNCSFTLRNLLMRGLIERIDNPSDSRGYLYRISFELLKTLGVERVQDLPQFEAFSSDDRVRQVLEKNEQK